MNLQLGINGATIPGADLLTGIHAASIAGFTMYEPRVPKLLECDSQPGRHEVKSSLSNKSLDWLPLNGLENVFALSVPEIGEAARRVCDLAAGFGIHQVILVPGAADRPISPNEAADTLEELKTIAASFEVNWLYEFIGFPQHAFSSLSQARSLAQATGIPLVMDTFHLAVSGTDGTAIRRMDASEIGLIHLSDALVQGRPLADLLDQDRVLPPEGGLPLPDYMQAFAEIGYANPVSVEVFYPRYALVEPVMGAREALTRACDVLTSAGFDLDKNYKN